MAKFVAPLQDEITRLARKEVTKNQKMLKKASVSLRRENTELRKRVKSLEKIVSGLQKIVASGKKVEQAPSGEELKTARMSPKMIARMREKHGLSRLKMAGLLGVNHMSLARWEQGKGAPRSEGKKKLIAFRNLSKCELKKLLGNAPEENETAPVKAKAKKTVAPRKATAKSVVKKAPPTPVKPAKQTIKTSVAPKKPVVKTAKPVEKKVASKKKAAKKAAVQKSTPAETSKTEAPPVPVVPGTVSEAPAAQEEKSDSKE